MTHNGPNASDKGFLTKLLGWLQTIQGIITTITAIIVAVGALVAVLKPNDQHSPTQSDEVEFEIAYADQPAVEDHYLFLFPNNPNVVYDLTFNTLVQDVHLSFPYNPMKPSTDLTNYWGHVELYDHTANHVQIYGAMKQGKGPITARLTVTYLRSGDPLRLVEAHRKEVGIR